MNEAKSAFNNVKVDVEAQLGNMAELSISLGSNMVNFHHTMGVHTAIFWQGIIAAITKQAVQFETIIIIVVLFMFHVLFIF